MGPGWDSLVGDQADIQMKFFRLEAKLWLVRRLWSRGTTTSLMAREEEEEAVQEEACWDGWWFLRLVSAKPEPTL